MVDPDWVVQVQWVTYIKHWTHISRIFTARKWSLGQGNVFTSIYHSFSTQGGRGSLHPRGSASRASASKEGLHSGGGFYIQGGWQTSPPGYYGIRSTSERYASYWNAFFFRGKSYQLKWACSKLLWLSYASKDIRTPFSLNSIRQYYFLEPRLLN